MSDRIAVGENQFIKEAFDSIYSKLTDQNAEPALLVLHGTSGVGKTEIALQIIKRMNREYENTGRNDVLQAVFNCDSTANLVADMGRFSDTRELHIPALRNGNSDLKQVFSQFYSQVEQRFPDHLKCFIFDDAEKPTQVIRHIDHSIISRLRRTAQYNQQKWKIIVTTQDADPDWFDGCDYLTRQCFEQVQGFNETETYYFFGTAGTTRLTNSEIREVRSILGNLPLALKVVRYEIQRNQLSDTSEFLRKYLDRVNNVDREFSLENKAVAVLHLSLSRLVDQINRTAECRELVQMLTLSDEKNFTTEMLVSYAEVIHPLNGNDAGYELANEFINEMMKRSLCEEPRRSCDTTLVSFHKLVKQSMILYRRPSDVQSEVGLVRKALIALTRVIPKDGRMHQSHSLFGYIYNHGKALSEEIEPLMTKNAINREDTPCIMLLYVNLLLGMGYCQLAFRAPTESAIRYLQKAIDVYSILMADVKYDQLLAVDPALPVDVQRAETLFGELIRSHLLQDENYRQLVTDMPQYYRLTTKDLRFMLDASNTFKPSNLTNGHLNRLHLMELRNQGKVLDTEKLSLLYPAELLAEIYSLWSKVKGFHVDSAQISGKCVECARAAIHLYNLIRRQHDVMLLAEVITRRESLTIHLGIGEEQVVELHRHRVQRMNLADIEREWRELEELACKAFEYGLMRTDFTKDNYNKFLCQEGLADCLGRRCQMADDEREKKRLYDEGESLFQQLIDRSKSESLNLQTTSKTFRHYAEFLWRCGKKCEAIRAVIDAMRYLHEFLREKDQSEPFPEQQGTCGKFKPLHQLLIQYYQRYKREPEHVPVLRTDGADANRLNYLTKFIAAWSDEKSKQAGGSDKYEIIEEILEASGMDPTDDNLMQITPSQATV